jgi:hypothetical protein
VEQNTHWKEWRDAVLRTGYTPQLKRAAVILETLDRMNPIAVQSFMEREFWKEFRAPDSEPT